MFRRAPKIEAPEVDREGMETSIALIDLDDNIPMAEKLAAKQQVIADAYAPVLAYHRAESEKWGRRADQTARVNVYIYAGLSVFYTIMAIGYLSAGRWGYAIFWALLAAGWGYFSVWTNRTLKPKPKAEDA